MATLAEIRARLQEQETRSQGNGQKQAQDNAVYPFWNIPENSTSTVRFLPDGDDTNTFPWRERQMIRIPFHGVKGGDENRPVTVTVPCVEMWKETCPIHAELRPWYKDPSLKELANKYWKKRSYVFQGFVVDSKLQEESLPENPIRRFIVNPSIFTIIKGALMDPDMESLFTDTENGSDFRLTKTTKGQYADYSTSSFARRERSLNEVERAAIEQYGLYNLNDFMPKKPTKEEVDIMYDMFKASVDGELYDPARWGAYFKPAGLNFGSNSSADSTPAQAPAAPKPAVAVVKPAAEPEDDDTPPFETDAAPAPAGKKDVNDILAMIRNRKQ